MKFAGDNITMNNNRELLPIEPGTNNHNRLPEVEFSLGKDEKGERKWYRGIIVERIDKYRALRVRLSDPNSSLAQSLGGSEILLAQGQFSEPLFRQVVDASVSADKAPQPYDRDFIHTSSEAKSFRNRNP